jgi:hypothetical protein
VPSIKDKLQGTALTPEERVGLGLEGLPPAAVLSLDQQAGCKRLGQGAGGYREVTVTVEDDRLPAPSVASALRVYRTREVFGTVQAQE